MNTWFSRAALVALTLSLIGCSSVPHETPEARQQMQREIGVSDIVDTSEMNWCILKYGEPSQCRAEQGLGVLTRTGLVMALYEGEHYRKARTLTTEEVICSAVRNGKNAPGGFIVFTENVAFMLVPLTANGAINTNFKAKAYDYLHSQGQPSFFGEDGVFARPSGKKSYGAVAAAPGVYVGTSQELDEVFNPCK
ncbi:hypothetical protein ACSC9U_03725 [Pseudomonas solani]|uniref:hypothetical protein n=1 Tax=Pseudomonas solani TaxID=2731552 RepID=UPI003F4AF551